MKEKQRFSFGIKFLRGGFFLILVSFCFYMIDIVYLAKDNPGILKMETFVELSKIYIASGAFFIFVSVILYYLLSLWFEVSPGNVLIGLSSSGFTFILMTTYVGINYIGSLFSAPGILISLFSFFTFGFIGILLIYLMESASGFRKSVVFFLITLLVLLVISSFMLKPESVSNPQTEEVKRINGPNILFILIDTLRADHLSFHGYHRNTAPALEKLTESGIKFDKAFAQASWTKPSIASIFTSTYPSRHNTTLLTERLPRKLLTLPEYLKQYGYQTLAFSSNSNISPEFGFGQGFDYFFNTHRKTHVYTSLLYTFLKKLPLEIPVNLTLENSGYNSGNSRDRILNREIKKVLPEKTASPSFLYVHYMSPHAPYKPPEDYLDVFRRYPDTTALYQHPMQTTNIFEKSRGLSEKRRQSLIDSYDGEIRYCNELIKELLRFLEKTGFRDNCLTIVTSDHGEEFYDHKSWGHKRSLYNETIHVPLILKFPDGIEKDKTSEESTGLVNLFPIICEVLGISIPEDINEMAFDGGNSNDNAVYSEITRRGYTSRSLITGEYKFIESSFHSKHRREFFSLNDDVNEKINLYEGRKELADVYEKQLDRIKKKAKKNAFKPDEIELKKEIREELKSLGYIR